jgi:Putative oxalocrotonate tautomerase enzyme
MPLWVIYHPEGTFATTESKQALSKSITTIYTSVGLPPFYVVVEFVALPNSNIFVGGENPPPSKPFVRIVVDHIAINMQGDKDRMLSMVSHVDNALKPHIADKGYGWEYHIDETRRELWKINGIVPPPCKLPPLT